MGCDQIRTNGWRQGSIFSLEDSTRLSGDVEVQSGDEYRFVLISHDCDIANPSLETVPKVEICHAKLCEADGNKLFGKNSRIIQLPLRQQSRDVYIELNCDDTCRIDRSELNSCRPSEAEEIDSEGVSILRSWLAARYSRSALPTEFNERRRNVWGKVRKKAKQGGKYLLAVYIAMEPRREELTSGQDYRVTLIGVMTDQAYQDAAQRKNSEDFVTDLAKILGSCSGIDVEEYEVRPEDDISLADLRLFLQRLDFDDLSLRQGESPPDH
jgi:hypothetical protein